MQLRGRIQVLFLPFLALLVLHLVLDRHFVVERDHALAVVEDQLDPARLALADLLQALVDQEAGERGFIITGQEQFLTPYWAGQVRADARLDELADLFPEGSALALAVERIRSRVTAWRQLGAEYEIEAKRAGRDEEAVDLVSTGTGMEMFDAARDEIVDLQGQLRSELEMRNERLDVLRARLTRLQLASLLVAVGLVLAGRWLLLRWISQPIQQLEHAVQEVAAGDLDRPIPAPGPPDLARLGHHVDAMRLRILSEMDDATRARAALAKRGMIVLTLREELAPHSVELPPGLVLASRHFPAEGVVAGDWFDVVRASPDRAAVALVDVSGHGSEAAIFALRTKALTLAALRSDLGPADALSWLSKQLGDTDERFLTAVVMHVDADTGRFCYASAGHPHLVLGGDDGITLLGPTGPLIGPLPGAWDEVEAKMKPGGFVVAYSDGVIEMTDEDGEELGIEGLLERLEGAGTNPERLVEACTGDLPGPGASFTDDLTVVAVGWSPPGAAESDLSLPA